MELYECPRCARAVAHEGAHDSCRSCRVLARVVVLPGEQCWPFTGRSGRDGYGKVDLPEGTRSAHRVVFEEVIGAMPAGEVVDHVCHNVDVACAGGPTCEHRRCCRPDHMTSATHKVNILHGRGLAAQHAHAEFCVRGHEFSAENTSVRRRLDGSTFRECIACRRLRKIASRARLAPKQEG